MTIAWARAYLELVERMLREHPELTESDIDDLFQAWLLDCGFDVEFQDPEEELFDFEGYIEDDLARRNPTQPG